MKASHEIHGLTVAARISGIPFDPDRKGMTTVHHIAGRTKVFSKGAPESLLPLCIRVLYNGETIALNAERRSEIVKAYREMMDSGLRDLALAFR